MEFLFLSCYWFIHCQNFFLLAMSPCVWASECVRACVYINIKLQNGCQTIEMFREFSAEVQPGVLTIAYERKINKQASKRTCNSNSNIIETFHTYTPKKIYEPNERWKKNSQLTMILNGLEQWQSHTPIH